MCCKGEPRASVSSDQMSRGNLKLMKLLNELGVTQSQVQFNNPIKYNVYTYIYLIKNILSSRINVILYIHASQSVAYTIIQNVLYTIITQGGSIS